MSMNGHPDKPPHVPVPDGHLASRKCVLQCGGFINAKKRAWDYAEVSLLGRA